MFSFSRSPATTLPNRESLRAAANSVCQENMATMAIVFVKRTRWQIYPTQEVIYGVRNVVWQFESSEPSSSVPVTIAVDFAVPLLGIR